MKLTITLSAGVLLILISSGFLFGSDFKDPKLQKNKKKLQLNAGYYNLGSIDEIYSYNRYSGSNVCFGLKYYTSKGVARDFTSFRYAMVNRTPASLVIDKNLAGPDSRERALNSFLFEAIYSYQYPLNLHLGDNMKFFVTGDWITTVNITTNSFGVPELVRSGISPGALFETNFKRHTLSARASFPVISWTVRNNYSQSMAQTYESLNKFTFIKQNNQLQFPNSLLEVDAEIEYSYDLSKHFIIGCEYDFRYMYNSSPRKLQSATGIYSAGVTYKF
jgi:hypothetical protein